MTQAEKEVTNWKEFNHPHLVKLTTWFVDRGVIQIIMEYVDGITLRTLIEEHQKNNCPFSLDFILRIFNQIISAIKYIHQMNLAHRDLKPENILITRNLEVIKICDFGLSRRFSNPNSFTLDPKGTFQYASPELILAKGSSLSSDIWSLGVILFELLNLKYPFSGNSEFELMNSIVNGKYEEIKGNYPQELKDLVSKMLIVEPSSRITIGEIENIMKQIFESQTLQCDSEFSSEVISKLNPEQIYELAQQYELGDGVPMNLSRSCLLFKKAAEFNHIESIYKYAFGLESGYLGEINKSEAIIWYKKAAEHLQNLSLQHKLTKKLFISKLKEIFGINISNQDISFEELLNIYGDNINQMKTQHNFISKIIDSNENQSNELTIFQSLNNSKSTLQMIQKILLDLS
jgi:serine/threonine protein kinase